MSKLSYSASRGCLSLNQFIKPKKVRRLVRETSTESYHNLDNQESQVALVEEVLRNAPEGLTDYELRNELVLHGVVLPYSSVAARRNDVNKKHKALKGHVIININKEQRINPNTLKKNLVWRYKQ